jgi:hypothetical protein
MQYAKIVLLSVTLAIASIGTSWAADARYVRLGETYYLYQLVGDNSVVQVVGVDVGNDAVRVRHVGGREEWVRAKDLLSRAESEAANTATNVGVFIGILGLAYCASSPDACKQK